MPRAGLMSKKEKSKPPASMVVAPEAHLPPSCRIARAMPNAGGIDDAQSCFMWGKNDAERRSGYQVSLHAANTDRQLKFNPRDGLARSTHWLRSFASEGGSH